MAHRYGHLIHVSVAGDGSPVALRWRAAEYRVREVLAEWALRDRWWSPDAASDRHYYRLDCEGSLLCDVYYDAAREQWVLDRVHD